MPFAEKVWYKEMRDNKRHEAKLESEWKEGLWLGHQRSSNEMVIGTTEGVVKAYAIRRKPDDEKWDAKLIEEMKGTPQQPNPNKSSAKIPIRIKFDEPSSVVTDEAVPARQEGPRRFRITIPMLVKYGYTAGCEGCRFEQAGLSATRAHTEECRKRIGQQLIEDPEYQQTIEREEERIRHNLEADVSNIEIEGRSQHNRQWKETVT